MSTSYNSGVVLGVKLDEIGFNAELISKPYNVFDKKGQSTGKVEYDHCWKINFQGDEIIEEGERLYTDVIEDIVNSKSPLKFFDISYEGFEIDNVVIGINIAHNGYNEYNVVKEIIISDKFDLVKDELKAQFGVDVEPKLYYYFQIS